MRALCFATLAAASLSAALPMTSEAATLLRRTLENGGSACTGALPTYEGALRKRPQAIANEGSNAAFITCSLMTDERRPAAPHFAYVRLLNLTASPVSATCTFVNGAHWEGSTSEVLTLEISANSSRNFQWGVVGGTTPFTKRHINFSCALPPGIALAFAGQEFREEVGTL